MSPISSAGAWALDARVTWRHRLDVPPVAMHAAPDDSFVLVADVFGTVRCLATDTGKVLWTRSYGMHSIHDVRATLAGAVVLLEEGRLLRLDQASGTEQWEAQVGALRSAFDATADGQLVALSCAVHEVNDGEVSIGAEVTLWDGEGKAAGSIRLDHGVTRLRFTSERGDLVCVSSEGHVSFLKDGKIARETQLGSTLQGLVTCLDGSLILTSAGTDGIHVLSASMQSLGVLDVCGPVEDVDVSEDGSSILVKERDGLIYLLDGRFRIRWRGRMDRPVLRVDLAGNGSFAYSAETTGEIQRFDFHPVELPAVKVEVPEETRALPEAAAFELQGPTVRPGLGRLAHLGGGDLVVLPRPDVAVICRREGRQVTLLSLPFAVSHATPDPARGRVALWSSGQLQVVSPQGSVLDVGGRAFSALAFSGDDLAVGTQEGHLRRLDGAGKERWNVRVGAAVLAVQACNSEDHLLALLADGSLVKVDGSGTVLANLEMGASVVAQPDVEGDGEALRGADGPKTGEVFWERYGRTFGLRMAPLGPLVFHGMGRILQLDPSLSVLSECHLKGEIRDVHPLGDGYLVLEAHRSAAVLDGSLKLLHRFPLGGVWAHAALGANGPVVFDADEEAVLLRGVDGTVLARTEVYPAPRAVTVSPEGNQGAALLDSRLLIFDLTG